MVRFAQDEGSGYYYGEINTKGKNGIGVLFYYNGSIYEGIILFTQVNGFLIIKMEMVSRKTYKVGTIMVLIKTANIKGKVR